MVGFGSKNVNVEHIRSLGALARERSFYVPADAIEEFRGRRDCAHAAARGEGDHSKGEAIEAGGARQGLIHLGIGLY